MEVGLIVEAMRTCYFVVVVRVNGVPYHTHAYIYIYIYMCTSPGR